MLRDSVHVHEKFVFTIKMTKPEPLRSASLTHVLSYRNITKETPKSIIVIISVII